MGDSIVPNTDISFSLLREKLATADFPGVGSDPGNKDNVSLSEFRGATFTDSTSVPSSGEISINDFKGKTFGATSTPQFDWHYYAYGSNIGTIYIYWSEDGGSTHHLRSITGQQHTGQTQSWNNYEEDLSSYAGQTGRIVIAYKIGSGFRQDIQLDDMELKETTSGNIDLDPGTSDNIRNRWQRYVSNGGYTTSLSYPSTGSWNTISIGTSSSNRWNYDAGGTPSSGTGGTRDVSGSTSGYYLYFEGSSLFSSSTRYYWIRMKTDYKLSGGGGAPGGHPPGGDPPPAA